MQVLIDPNVRLLKALIQELKLPLLQIARQSELARLQTDPAALKQIEATADAAMKLIDSYALSAQALLGQQTMALEPVSVSAALYDTAQYLRKMGTLYECTIDVRVKGKVGLVMANPIGLQAALTSLAYSLISTPGRTRNKRIVLTAEKTAEGIATGVASSGLHLPKDTLSRARKLYGQARQPLAQASHSQGAGIYVADILMQAMTAELRVAGGRGRSGFVATMLPSQQLAFL